MSVEWSDEREARQVTELYCQADHSAPGQDSEETLTGLLAKLTDCLSSLSHLSLAVSLLTKDISQTDTGLYRTQLRRQTDIWTLLSAAVSHRPASDLALVEQEVELNNLVIRENIQAREAREVRGED